MKIQKTHKAQQTLAKLTNLLRQALFAQGAHRSRKPVWTLLACPEAALAMRGSPLPPEHGQKIRAARTRQMRRAADRRRF